MKSKKYLLVVLSVLILFLFITSASAADANETDVISIDESINLENNLLSDDNNVKSNDILKSSNDELLTAGNDWYVNSSKDTSGDGKSENAAFKTLNESLNEAQDGDTIWIASGEYTGNDNIGLTIAKNLNFIKNGGGEAIFDAENSGNIWTVNSTSINITGLTFKNGNSTYGGAIYISHEVKSNINATFINNTAVERGGAIYIVSGGISGTLNGVFINNTASDWGGAIYIDSGGISGNVNGTFINNKGSSGSAIFIAGDISGNLNGTFINNEAKGHGAIYIYNGDASGNINGTFINNVANQGGAIAVGDAGKISGNVNGIFINNTGYYSGGAISIDNTEFYSTGKVDGIFINNKAEEGGAIYIEFTYNDPNVSLGGTFINNNASRGGAIFINQLVEAITIQDSIFLNNNVVLSKGIGSYIKTIDCWFGNNATNYNSRPDAGNAVMDRWLFLNATANSTDVSVDQNSIIAFKLDSYDNSSGEIKSYDASKMKFILDFTQTLGELDKTAALIGENITYTARQGGNSTVTGKYETGSYTIELNNVKIPTEINVTDSTIALNAGGEADVGATLTPADAGNLTYTSNNTNVVVVENGKIKALANGTAVITVSFPGNENYTAAENKTINVTVNLKDAIISVNNSTLNLFVGDNFTVVATTTPAGLKVTFVQDDSGVYIVDGNGNVTALKEGTGHILVKVGGDGVYAENTTEITVSVSKIPTEITLTNATLDLKVNEIVDGLANLTPANAGNLTFTSSDEDIVFVADGVILARGKGNATVTVSFAGNDKYAAALNRTIHVNVSLNDASVSVENDTLELKVDERYDLNATAVPSFLNVEYVSSNESVATVTDYGIVTAVGEGTTTITLTVGNDVTYAVNTTNVTVTVSKIPTEITVDTTPLDLFVGDEIVIVANLTPAGAGNVTFTSSDYDVVDFDFEGIVIAQGKGQAIITVSFAGDDKYAAAENKTIIINVSLDNASVTVDNNTLDLKVGETSAINATKHPDTIMLDITYTSSNNSVVTVDKKGIVTAVGEGTTVITVEVGDGEIYAKNSTTVNVTVRKISTEIASSAVTTVYNVDKNLIVTLKDADGKPISGASITVDLNGAKTYTTDKKGQITVSTKGLVPKAYTAKITFNGNSKYAKSTKDVKVTVKKATPKITAKAKTFKTTTKTKKYSIVLKNNVNKPIKKATVYLKVSGKTYKATTNSKGKATFKITNLNKKGTYKAAVTYKGNKYYNKATKKVTIKVKSVWKTVSKGSKESAIVKKIQRALKNNGYYLEYNGRYLMVDGIYWDYTEMAVKEFQNDKVLKVTGKVDEKTAKKLGII